MPTGPILIVDDEAQNLAVLRQVLSEQYADLVFARNGIDAIDMTKKHQPSLILLDIQMPDIDGLTVCRKLKADRQTHHIPIIFVTSMAEVGDEASGFAAGAVDYIHKPFSPSIVLARVKIHLSLVNATSLKQSYSDAIFMLGQAGHYKDSDTGVHIWRMSAYCRALAEAIGWSQEQCDMLVLAAMMHDTGKIGIPERILHKPGALDESEWEIMKTHSVIGHKILSRSDAPVFKMAAEIALYHHERWDGSGYPEGLKGHDIPMAARIVAVADVFDALGMKRPYKEAWPIDKIMATLHTGNGNHFDPFLIETFASILPKIVEIKKEWDTREQGMVA